MRTDLFPSRNTLADVHNHLLIPAAHALKDVERAGMRVDVGVLDKMSVLYQAKIKEIEDNIRSYPEVIAVEKRLGKTFNVRSSDQVRDLLFQQMGIDSNGLPKTKETGRPSTNKATIASLKDNYPVVGMLNQHRKYTTLHQMFVKPMFRYLCPDGRIHPSLNFFTTTGRLSSEKPNEQNIPKNIDAEEIGFDFDPELNIKYMFIPSGPDFVIVQADYSQMELRIVAEYSEDEFMYNAFKNNVDIHLATGALLAGHPIDKHSPWRKKGKTLNFALLYGKGARTLAKDLKMSVPEAQALLDDYFSKIPKVKDFLTFVENYCREHKYVVSMFGRIRILRTVDSYEKEVRNEALRQATNMPIQSSASDYTLSSLINIMNLFNEFAKKYHFKSRIIATVHDSILFDVYRPELKTVVEIINTIMPNPDNPLIYWDNKLNYKVDIETGDSWGSLTEYSV